MIIDFPRNHMNGMHNKYKILKSFTLSTLNNSKSCISQERIQEV